MSHRRSPRRAAIPSSPSARKWRRRQRARCCAFRSPPATASPRCARTSRCAPGSHADARRKTDREGGPVRLSLGRAVLAAVALALAAPAALAQEAVRVASKIDTEGALLGSMMLEMLDAAGIKTVNKLQLGPTNILRSA